MAIFARSTPLERYRVGDREVWVKRDDLFAKWPAPPLGKLRGARALLGRLYRHRTRLVGCWDTRISALGQGIAACATELPGLQVIVAYPASQGSAVPLPLQIASQLGAEVLPVRAGRISISFAAARKVVQERGGFMLPFGLECFESVAAIQQEAAALPEEAVHDGTVIVSCGSGVTLAGLVRGLHRRAARYIGVSSGRSVEAIQRCLSKYVDDGLDRVKLIQTKYSYDTPLNISCPFPSHPNYDQKAWDYLLRHFRSLRKPILFWNVGAAAPDHRSTT